MRGRAGVAVETTPHDRRQTSRGITAVTPHHSGPRSVPPRGPALRTGAPDVPTVEDRYP
ncbi:hypothetical protein ACFFSW_18160 [Saccharothrix longispora]|uniref:Uncharacterized protein n=1 Tax=Saccharothrix longispora TaxID=33920 RepID=A0ABU1PS84_9PSEU|nr:hypothetical protein [Saccharothrix longispora]MDR6593494.1 hypothetical protein [Saccharothrix longispora]